MRLRDIHLWTAIAVIAFCGFAAVSSWNILQFSLAARHVAKNKPSEARAWVDVAGVAASAWQVELNNKIDPFDPIPANNRREVLSELLAIKPLSPYHWLILSGLDFTTDQQMGDVLDTLALSALTGPNEAYVMAERGIFGLLLWENLPPDLKRRVTADFTAERIDEKPNFRSTVNGKSQEVRNELRTALLAEGMPLKRVERLGF